MSCSVGDDTPMDILNKEATSIWPQIRREEKLLWRKRISKEGRKTIACSIPIEWVVHLKRRKRIEEGTYPHFTMIGQSLGSVYLSWEALSMYTTPLFGCKVICYTHYPTISSHMVSRVICSQHENAIFLRKKFGVPSIGDGFPKATANTENIWLSQIERLQQGRCAMVQDPAHPKH